MKKKYIITTLLLIFTVPPITATAQYHFTAQVVYSSGCNDHTNVYHDDFDLTGAISLAAAKSMCEDFSSRTWETADWCEAARETVLSWNSTTACRIKVVASQCVGPNGGKIGDINLQGPSTGSSYYSTNPAEEVQNWAEDAEALMDALSANNGSGIVTDDGYLFTGRMPGDIKKFSLSEDNKVIEIRNSGKHSGVTGLDDYINSEKPFQSLGPWDDYSDDLATKKIELKQVSIPSPPKEKINELWADILGDIVNIGMDAYSIAVELGSITAMTVGTTSAAMTVVAVIGADLAVNLIVEDVRAAIKMYNGELITTEEILTNAVKNSGMDLFIQGIDMAQEKKIYKAPPIVGPGVSIARNLSNLIDHGTQIYKQGKE